MNEIINGELIENTYLFCIKRIDNDEEAKDLAQDILYEAVRTLASGRKIIKFYSWYWKMAKNKYVDFIRRKHDPHLPLEAAGGIAADASLPVEHIIAKEDLAALNFALSRLASTHREIMIRFYLREQSVGDIAAELDIPAGTVKSRLFDARKKLKERFDNMNNIGKYSYAPAQVNWFCGGSAVSASCFMSSSQMIPQIMVICRTDPKTVNDIADEMGVAPVYLEEFLRKMTEKKLLIHHGKDKFLANCCMFPKQKYIEAEIYANKEFHENKFPEKISERLVGLKNRITSLDFYGNHFDYSYLMWLLYVSAGEIFGLCGRKKYLERYKDKYPEEQRDYFLTVEYILPEDNFDGSLFKQLKAVNWSCLHQNFMTSDYGRVTFINDFENEPFPNDGDGSFSDDYRLGRDMWIDGSNISLLMDLVNDPKKRLSEYEEEKAAAFLKKGLIKKENDRLNVQIPVFSSKVKQEINGIISSEISYLAEEYADTVGRNIEKILLPYVRRDLMSNFLYWDMRAFFQVTTGLFWYGWDKHLALPNDYSRSAAGLYLLIE